MPDNLFANLPPLASKDEVFTTLLTEPGLTVQRIVSTGQSSPPGFWYDQPEAEWVVLIDLLEPTRLEHEGEPLGDGFAAGSDAHDVHRIVGVERCGDPVRQFIEDVLHIRLVVVVTHCSQSLPQLGSRSKSGATSCQRGIRWA